MTITPEDVARLREAATPGPWIAVADETAAQIKGFPRIEAEDYEIVGCEGMYGDYAQDWANAAFIAAAHDMADLVERQAREIAELTADRIEELEAALAKAVTALRDWIEFANEEGMPVSLSDLEAAGLTGGEDELG